MAHKDAQRFSVDLVDKHNFDEHMILLSDVQSRQTVDFPRLFLRRSISMLIGNYADADELGKLMYSLRFSGDGMSGYMGTVYRLHANCFALAGWG